MKRRRFISNTTKTAAGISLLGLYSCNTAQKKENSTQTDEVSEPKPAELFFKMSLAEWSFHNAIQSGEMDHLDFAAKARSFGLEGVEYVTQLFAKKNAEQAYLDEMKNRADQEGIQSLLIMVDKEGDLATTDDASRTTAIENHYKWVDAAAFLGCHSIRVNAAGDGTPEEQKIAGIDGLGRLSEFAADKNINVIVENHGGMSSNADWLVDVISQVNMPNCGLLPDFGNFCVKEEEDADGNKTCVDMYDRYKGVEMMMPFAKAVSAKSKTFDTEGNETQTDYFKMLQIVKDGGYSGFIGIEFEGEDVSEEQGIILTRDLLIKAGGQLS